jgi:hypothetical protein
MAAKRQADHTGVSEKVAPAQIEEIGKWGAPLRLSGSDYPADQRIHPSTTHPECPVNSVSDAENGSQYQCPELFLHHVSMFLSDAAPRV